MSISQFENYLSGNKSKISFRGYQSSHRLWFVPKSATATVIYTEHRNGTDPVYHVRISVPQSKFNPQSTIELNSALKCTQRLQEDVTTRPKSRSPAQSRFQMTQVKMYYVTGIT